MKLTSARRALAAGIALVATGVLPGFLVASLAPRIRADFAFGDSRLGLAVAAFYLISALSSTPAGRLVDRAGARRGTAIGGVVTAISCVAIAALAHSAAGLIALLLLAALGNAIAGPAVSTLLEQELPPERHGVGFGAQHAGAPFGALLAGLALPLVAIPLGWRWAFAATAVAALVAVAATPAGAPASGARERRGGAGGLSSVHALGLAAALASAASAGLVSFLVVYAVDSGIGAAGAGLLLSGVSLAAATGRAVLGAVADRRGHDPLRPVVVMLFSSVAAYAVLIAGEPSAIVAGSILAGGLGWAWPGALNLAVVQRSNEASAWAVGVMLTGLFSGAVAGPLIVGLLAEADLFALAWLACAGFALLAALTVAAVIRSGSRPAASGTRRRTRPR